MTDTFGNPITVPVTPIDPAAPPVVVTPAGAVVTPVTPTTPVPNRPWKIDLYREIATMKAQAPVAYVTEAEELADLNGDIHRMLAMAAHNATARELVTFLEALVKKYTDYRQDRVTDTGEVELPQTYTAP